MYQGVGAEAIVKDTADIPVSRRGKHRFYGSVTTRIEGASKSWAVGKGNGENITDPVPIAIPRRTTPKKIHWIPNEIPIVSYSMQVSILFSGR